MRLELDGEELELQDDRDGALVVQEWELTFPDIRAVAEANPWADGETDRTAFLGARALTLKMRIHPVGRQETLDRLRRFCHPASRPWLYFQDGGPERRIQLRADSQSAPIAGRATEVAASWRCPYPFAEAVDPTVVSIRPDSTGAGRTYPWISPRTYPAASFSGLEVENAGNMPARWVARIFGPATDPSLVNVTTGESVVLEGLVVAAGDYLEVDSEAQSVLVNGSPAASRYSKLDPSTRWWKLQPGTNLVRLVASATDTATQAEITTRSTWL